MSENTPNEGNASRRSDVVMTLVNGLLSQALSSGAYKLKDMTARQKFNGDADKFVNQILDTMTGVEWQYEAGWYGRGGSIETNGEWTSDKGAAIDHVNELITENGSYEDADTVPGTPFLIRRTAAGEPERDLTPATVNGIKMPESTRAPRTAQEVIERLRANIIAAADDIERYGVLQERPAEDAVLATRAKSLPEALRLHATDKLYLALMGYVIDRSKNGLALWVSDDAKFVVSALRAAANILPDLLEAEFGENYRNVLMDIQGVTRMSAHDISTLHVERNWEMRSDEERFNRAYSRYSKERDMQQTNNDIQYRQACAAARICNEVMYAAVSPVIGTRAFASHSSFLATFFSGAMVNDHYTHGDYEFLTGLARRRYAQALAK